MTAVLSTYLSVFLAQAAATPVPTAPADTAAAPAATTTATTGATPAATGTAPSTQPPTAPGLFASPVVPLLLMGVIFYFMLIRPQQRRAREQANLVSTLKSGDEVLTSAGIYGTVTNVNPEKKTITVRIADNVRVTMTRDSVASVVNKSAATTAAAA